MKRSLAVLITVVCLALTPSAALAAAEGFYLGGHLGAALLDEGQNDSSSGTFNTDYDPGFGGWGVFGYDLGDRYPRIGRGRVELEVGYRSNDLKEVEFLEGGIAAGGDVSVLSFMANSFAEYDNPSRCTPYLGLGLGYAMVSLNDTTTVFGPLADDDDGVFAYQFGAGLGLALTERVTVDAGYRYFATTDAELVDATGERFDAEYSSHNFSAGVRVRF